MGEEKVSEGMGSIKENRTEYRRTENLTEKYKERLNWQC